MSHTPVPWEIESVWIAQQTSGAINFGEYRFRGYPQKSREEVEANARLISAAPDFYEAAKGVLAAFEAKVFVRNTQNDHDTAWAIKSLKHLRALAQLAVAVDKAEGKPEQVRSEVKA